MFYFLNKRTILQLILLIVGLAVVLFRLLPGECALMLSDDIPVFSHSVVQWLNMRPAFFKFFIVFNIFFQLLILFICFHKNDFSEESISFMPLVFYVGLLNTLPVHHVFSNIFFLNTLILIVLLITIYFNNASLKGRVFFAGMLIGIGTMLSATMLFLLIHCLVALIIYRFSGTKDIVILFIGILLPFIYLFSYYYLTDQVYTWSMIFDKLVVFDFQSTFLNLGVTRLILLFALFLIGIILIFTQKVLFDNKAILLRRRLTTMAVFFVTTILVILFNCEQFPYNLQYLFVPMSVYLTLESQIKKPRLRHDLLILVSFAIIVLLNYLP